MNENAKKWVQMLRTTELKQGKGQLKTPEGGYCCLGIACILYEQETGNPLPDLTYNAQLDGEHTVVREWLGLQNRMGTFHDFGFSVSNLTKLNDDGATFKEIADVIESEPEGLFLKAT